MRNIVVTLDIDYPKEITDLTFPLMRRYADNIDADFCVITERRYPDLPVTLEKLQLWDLAQDRDWAVFFDADCVVNPEVQDPDWHQWPGVWVSQSLPLTQFDWPLALHAPTYFLAFRGQDRSCVLMPPEPMSWAQHVRHPDPARRQWLLDDLIINHNISRQALPFRTIAANQIAHLGYEGCGWDEKIGFIRHSLMRLGYFNA